MLDCLDSAVFLLDRAARVSWHNRSADRVVVARDGLTIAGNRLLAQWAGDNRKLAAALSTRTTTTIRITRLSGQPSYVAQAHHLSVNGAAERALIALLVTAPERMGICKASLMDVYELTPAEARVAVAVVHGDGLASTARNLHVSVNTVKSTLQRVYSKTQTRSQLQLVRLLVSTVRHTPPVP